MHPFLLLHAIGESLWGPRWQTEMADALHVAPRTVRRWVAGDPIPQGIWSDLIQIMEERAKRLERLRTQAWELLPD